MRNAIAYHATDLTVAPPPLQYTRLVTQARTNKIHCPPTNFVKNWQVRNETRDVCLLGVSIFLKNIANNIII